MLWLGTLFGILNKLVAERKFADRFGKQIGGMLLAVSLFGIVLSSCGSLPSHEIFVQYNDSRVGRNFDKENRSTSVKGYVDGRFLPNGNVEYGFKWRATCRVYYEVNPETRIIVDWRWEGTVCVLGG